MRDAGLRMAFGSDLLGGLGEIPLHGVRAPGQGADPSRDHQLGHGGGRGVVPDDGADRNDCCGAFADLVVVVVVDGNSLADIAPPQGDGAHMPLIMAGGRVVKERV